MEPQDLWKLICVSMSIIIMKKIAEKNLFPIFMSKIINSFPYAMC